MSIPSRLARIVSIGFTLAILAASAGFARADIVLFTASTDNSGGANPVSVPGTNNPNIPTIDPGVTLTPNPALLDGNITYGLGGVDYGPFGFGGNTGGNTDWVHVAYTVTTAGDYQLIWEVAGADKKIGSALTIDNVQVNGSVVFGFEGGIPGDFSANGKAGTSGPLMRTDATGTVTLADFAATEGSKFAYLDISGGKTPIYDTVDSYAGSQLYSRTISLNSGDAVSLDMAFLTNEGDPFHDYGIATLRAVPEPSSLVLLGVAIALIVPVNRLRANAKSSKARGRVAGF